MRRHRVRLEIWETLEVMDVQEARREKPVPGVAFFGSLEANEIIAEVAESSSKAGDGRRRLAGAAVADEQDPVSPAPIEPACTNWMPRSSSHAEISL